MLRLAAVVAGIALSLTLTGVSAGATPATPPAANWASVSPANLLAAAELPPMPVAWRGPGVEYPNYGGPICTSWPYSNFPGTVTEAVRGNYGAGEGFIATALAMSFDTVASATAERDRWHADFSTCQERYPPVNNYEWYPAAIFDFDAVDGVPVHGVRWSFVGYESLGYGYTEAFVVQNDNRLLFVEVQHYYLTRPPHPRFDLTATVPAAKQRIAAP